MVSRYVQELRWQLNPLCPKSAALLTYIEHNYGQFKMLNPLLPFLVRESAEVDPTLWVRYGNTSSLSLSVVVTFQGSQCYSRLSLRVKSTAPW